MSQDDERPVLSQLPMYHLSVCGKSLHQHEFTVANTTGGDGSAIVAKVNEEAIAWVHTLTSEIEDNIGPLDPKTMTLHVWGPMCLTHTSDKPFILTWGFEIRNSIGQVIYAKE